VPAPKLQVTMVKPLSWARVAANAANGHTNSKAMHPDGTWVCKPPPVTASAAQLFSDRCKAEGRNPIERGGEGDCQIISMIHELRVKKLGDFSVPKLRDMVASWFEANTEPMDGFIVTDEFPSWDDYCHRIRDSKLHTWGDNLVLIAVCAIFGVNIRVTSITEAYDRVITAQDGVFCEVELHLGHIPEQHYVAMTPSSDGTQTEIKRNREEMKAIDRRKGAAKEPTVLAPKLDMDNRFAVLGASADEDETASLEDLKDTPKAPFTTEDYATSTAFASLVGLEDKPKTPTSAATVEMIVPSLDFIGLEAKIELQEPKLLYIEDKADTTLKVP
jgi:hypothetical protein